MLLLTRRVGENIRIGEEIKVYVIYIQGGHVKLGIEAPPSVKVHREEIYQLVKEEATRG